MTFGIDYAWGKPNIRALKRAGVTFVCRYLSYDPTKNLTSTERLALAKAGIDVEVIWETTANRAIAGEEAGRSDALNAIAQARMCGIPDTKPIYLAVDFDAAGPDVETYFRGAHAILGARTGAYAGIRPIRYLFDHGLIHHAWQTYAWSDGEWEPRAHLRQISNGHELAGVSCDYNTRITILAADYVPADEARWEREYDRLAKHHGPWARLRRRVLRRYMTRRLLHILHLAHNEPNGWNKNNRANRYKTLIERTG